jgi:hypothetical protein
MTTTHTTTLSDLIKQIAEMCLDAAQQNASGYASSDLGRFQIEIEGDEFAPIFYRANAAGSYEVERLDTPWDAEPEYNEHLHFNVTQCNFELYLIDQHEPIQLDPYFEQLFLSELENLSGKIN